MSRCSSRSWRTRIRICHFEREALYDNRQEKIRLQPDGGQAGPDRSGRPGGKLANNLLEQAGLERDEASARIAELERQLKELRSRPVEVAVMEVDQEKLAAVRAETAAEMQAEIDRVRAAKQKAEEKQRAAEEALAAARDQIQAFEGKTTQTGPDADEDLVMFRVLVGQARETINKMGELLVKIHERENFNAAVLARREMVELSKYMYIVASPHK